MSAGETMAAASDDKGALPWTMVPRFTPGVTDVMEWTKKLKFLSELWPKDQLSALTTRVALQCEGTAFKRISRLSPEKLKVNDLSGIKLIVETVGGSWGQTALEERYEFFERAIYEVQRKSDESHGSYLSRHDICFDELLSQGTTFEELRAYVLVRQSLLSSEDKKRIVIEHQGALSYEKVKASIQLLGSKFFGDLQGNQRSQAKSKVYDVHAAEETYLKRSDKAIQPVHLASGSDDPEPDLDEAFLDTMVAMADALHIQGFEEELEMYFQETPEMHEALTSYVEARQRLLQKKKSRGFWPVGSGSTSKGGGKGGKFGGGGKGKHKGRWGRDQLLLRICRSSCRLCGKQSVPSAPERPA